MFNLIEWMYLKQKGNLVYYDCLTGAKSRMYYDRVVKVKYHHKEVVVAFVDIDNLKDINDEHGHQVGSKHISNIAKQLLNLPGTYDVCRIGGDEFILIGDFDPESLLTIEGISTGTVVKEKYEDLSSAVRKADERMYRNKTEHHNNSERKDTNEE